MTKVPAYAAATESPVLTDCGTGTVLLYGPTISSTGELSRLPPTVLTCGVTLPSLVLTRRTALPYQVLAERMALLRAVLLYCMWY